MNKYVTIDSCVFVSALHEQEEHSTSCLKFLEQIDKGKYTAILPTIVLVEIVAAIKRRTNSRELATKARDSILSLNNLTFVDIDYNRMLNITDFAAGTKLRGMDAIIAGIAKEFNCSLATLDIEVKKLLRKNIKFVNL